MTRIIPKILLLSLLSAPIAWASETKVAVIILPGDDKQREGMMQQKMLNEAYQQSGDELPWILVAFQRITPELTQGDVADMTAGLVKKGKKAYQYMKLAEAQRYFEKAASLMRKRPLTRCAPDQPAQMYLYWARAVLDGGDEARAQQLLEQVQRFDPKASPDPAVMPPKLVATFDIASDERGNKPEAKTLLEIGPNPGTIVVNCRRMPPGVVEFKGVAGDELWIAAEIAGGTFASAFVLPGGKRRQIIIFSGQQNEPLAISRRILSLSRRMVSMGDLRSRSDSDLDRLANKLGVQALLLGQLKTRDGTTELFTGLYIPSKGLQSDPIGVPVDKSGAPIEQKLSLAFSSMGKQMSSPSVMAALAGKEKTTKPDAIKKAATTPPPKQIKADGVKSESPAWYRTWWFWTATGVVVAGAVTTGLVLGLRDTATDPSGKVVLTISEP